MPAKKKTKRLLHPKLFHPLLLTILLLVVSIAGYHLFNLRDWRPFIKAETDNNIVQQVPKEVAKTLPTSTPGANLRVPILMYHYVEHVKDPKDTIRISLNILPEVLDQQIKTLQDAHYTFMTTGELGEVLDGKRELPPNPIILTFDDGYWDLDTDVLPILKKYNVKATAYIVPGFINGSNSLSDAQLQDVFNSKLVEIGAHTMHHVYLKGMSEQHAAQEILESKRWLEERFHVPVVSFAYPYGAFDLQAIKLVKEAGFTNATSTIPGIEVNQNDRYFIYRIRPGHRVGQELLNYLSSNYFKPY